MQRVSVFSSGTANGSFPKLFSIFFLPENILCFLYVNSVQRSPFLFLIRSASILKSPEPKNEHFLELKQQKNGRWGAVDGIQSGEHRATFNWRYGTDYRMPLAVSGRELTGILRHGWPRSHPDRRSPHGRGRCRDFRPKSAAYFRAETAPLTAYFSAILQFS